MCEFCVKHGEGQKWYLEAKNYSEDLLSDLRRRKFIEEFMANPGGIGEGTRSLKRLRRAPSFVRRVFAWRFSSRMKNIHYGQVVPIEDVEHIFDFVTSVVRLACICRQATLGSEQRYCYAVSMQPDGGKFIEIIRGIDASYLTGPDSVGLETLGKDDALTAIRDHEKEGLCHSVWTFHAPFIGGICNCDRSDCLAMRSTVTHGLPLMFRARSTWPRSMITSVTGAGPACACASSGRWATARRRRGS